MAWPVQHCYLRRRAEYDTFCNMLVINVNI